MTKRYRGRAARQWSATPSTAVRIRSIPQQLNPCNLVIAGVSFSVGQYVDHFLLYFFSVCPNPIKGTHSKINSSFFIVLSLLSYNLQSIVEIIPQPHREYFYFLHNELSLQILFQFSDTFQILYYC